MSKPTILTGLRATNDLHIGNYFGALLPLIDIAKKHAGEYQINLFMPDLHSITTPVDYSKLHSQIMENIKTFVAAGLPLDNPDVHLYRQSYISGVSELTLILDCFTGFGEMGRMTQFKDKSAKLGAERISVGLFNYPVLMAVDILAYGAEYVPVGDDQSQHIEFTRDIGERMNSQFGDLFTLPKPVKEQHEFFGKDQGLRIKDLLDPSKKMSKSDESGRGVIFLNDSPDEAAKKIMGAATDSVGTVNLDFEKQPGIGNLLQILALLTERSIDEVAKQYRGQASYGELKKDVAEALQKFLINFQSAYKQVNDAAVKAKLEASEVAMNAQVNRVVAKVQKAVGLRE